MRRREQTVTGRWPACASYKEKSRRPEREGWGRAPGSGQDTDLQPDGRGGGAGIPRGPGRGRGQGSVQAGPCESFWGAGSTGGSVGLVGDVSWGRMSDCPCEGSLGTGWRRRHSQERSRRQQGRAAWAGRACAWSKAGRDGACAGREGSRDLGRREWWCQARVRCGSPQRPEWVSSREGGGGARPSPGAPHPYSWGGEKARGHGD